MKTFDEMMAELDIGQKEAIIRKVARAQTGDETVVEQALRGVLSGDLHVVLVDGTVKLVDSAGRCIPLPTMKGEYKDANRDFRLVQPEIDYVAIIARLQQFFAPETKFISASEFAKQAVALIEQIKGDKQVANLLKGVYLPICLPQLKFADYGRTLEETFLAAVERAYKAQYPDRAFNNYRKGELAGQVSIAPESCHQRLIEKMAEGPVVLVHFPNPMQGFSIPADRKMIGAFPDGFMLSGALDTATSIVANTSTLALNWNTPGLDCSANSWQSAEFSLSFGADVGGLDFGRRFLGADVNYSGGLSFVG